MSPGSPPHSKATYTLQWSILLTLVMAALAFYGWTIARRPGPVTPLSNSLPGHPSVDWYLMLRMPEITAQYESGIETMRVRFNEWLVALEKAGFRPMLFSDIHERLEREGFLPDKTTVIFFTPAWRRTVETVGPSLARHHFPGLWLTDGTALQLFDRRFVTYRTTRLMKQSGLWDIGFSGSRETFRIEPQKGKAIHLGGASGKTWAPMAGAYAINRGPLRDNLNYLAVIADWLPQDLINRLLAETPVEEKVILTKGKIQDRFWGIALSTASSAQARFDMEAPLDKKATRLFWLCTQGHQDFHLRLTVASVLGELWLRLRYAEASGDGLFLVPSGGRLTVLERRNKIWRHLFVGKPSQPQVPEGLRVDVRLMGHTLSVSVNGGPWWNIETLPGEPPPHGIVELYLADRMRGVAKARGIRMTYTPWHEGLRRQEAPGVKKDTSS